MAAAAARTHRSSRRTAARPQPRGAARREALLEAVLRIVAEVGADAVTHRRVADVAGLPLASTTYYFESKDHLLTAALELAAERDIARLHEFAVAPAGGHDGRDGHDGHDGHDPIALAIDAIMDPFDEHLQATRGSLIATYALLLEAARRPALQAITRRWTDAYLEVLSDLLALAGSSDSLRDSELLLAATDGLLIGQLASGTGGDLIPRLRHLATVLVSSG